MRQSREARRDRVLVAPHHHLRGRGVLARGDHEVAVTFWVQGSLYRPADEWEVEIALADAEHDRWDQVLDRDGGFPLVLRGRTENNHDVLLPEVHQRRWVAGRLEAYAWDLRIDCVPQEDALPDQRVTVYLTPTPLPVPRPFFLVFNQNGELSPLPERDGKERPDDVVTTSAGGASFTRDYLWETVDVAGVQGDLRIPAPALHLTIAAHARSADPMETLQHVNGALADVLDVLSFLSRRFVRWTRMYLSSSRSEGEKVLDYRTSEWWRTIGSPRDGRSREPLVNLNRMPPDGIERMLAAYRSKAHRSLRAAITYSLAVQERTHLEAAFTSAITALEALLKATEPPGSKMVTSKRAAAMIETAGVRWDDLWPAGTALETALKAIFDRRNTFVHEGVFPEITQAHVDTERLALVCERVLFSLLDGDEDWRTPVLDRGKAGWLAAHPA